MITTLAMGMHDATAATLQVGPGETYTTIQAAIDAASPGDTINVAAGVYAEQVQVNKRVNLVGAGSGLDGSILQSSITPAVLLAANGLSSSEPVRLSGFRIDAQAYGTAIEMNNGLSYARVENCWVRGGNVGLRAGTGADISHLAFIGLTFFGNQLDVFIATRADPPSFADDIIFQGCMFSGAIKGIYAEKFSNAVITNCQFASVATNQLYSWSAAIDLNLKWGVYSNILITGSYFTNCGVGAIEGVAIGIKARGTGSDTAYASHAATLSGVMVSGCTIVDCERGIRIGEPGKTGMTGPTNVLITGNKIYNNILRNTASPSPAGNLVNLSIVPVSASRNYWGSPMPVLSALVNGPSTIESCYVNATLTDLRYLQVYVDVTFDAGTAGWGQTRFATIQGGIDAAAVGGTVTVNPGEYNGKVTIAKAVTLLSAEGSALTTIKDTAGTGLGTIQVVGPTTGVQVGSIGHGFTILGIDSQNPGLEYAAIYLQGANTGTRIIGNRIVAAGESGLSTEYGQTLSGVVITDNEFAGQTFVGANPAGFGFNDQFTLQNVPRQLAVVQGAGGPVTFSRNIISGTAGGTNTSGQAQGNTLVTIDTANALIAENTFSGLSTRYATALRIGGAGTVVTGNVFLGQTPGGLFVRTAAGATANVTRNSFIGFEPSLGAALENQGASILNAQKNWWGVTSGPLHGTNPTGMGSVILGNVLFAPWYGNLAMTQLQYIPDAPVSFSSDMTIGLEMEVTVPGVLSVGTVEAPVTVTVNGGTLSVEELNLTEGSSIEVINGTLVLGSGEGAHTMSGTFTIYNSFGSVYIEEDTTFSGDTLSLISNIHVTPGKTLTVSGSLVLDGCTLDSTVPGSRFNMVVTDSGSFKMVRTELLDANISLLGDATDLRDNVLSNVTITVAGSANTNRIYHNVFASGVTLTDGGVGTITTLDGWGNVATVDEARNTLTVSLSTANLDATRTLTDGNLFIQPGDLVRINLAVGDLQEKIAGVEAMMGFSTDFFTPDAPSSLDAVSPWEYEIHELFGADGVYGKLDTSIGLDIAFPDPVGTTADGMVAAIDLSSKADADDGVTKFYFRAWQPNDNPLAGTRLTGFDGTDDYQLDPFTLNSGFITVDGTRPEIANFTASQTREGVTTNVFFADVFTRQGTVVFTVDAFDALAGIDDGDVVLTLTNGAVALTPVLTSTSPLVVGDQTWTRYTFQVPVLATTPNGVYGAKVILSDRSGNNSEILVGEIEVDKNQIAVTVQLQGAVAGPFSRDVTFVATAGNGTLLATWVRTVTFTAGVGTDILVEAPAGMANLSAKTDYTLRRKLVLGLDADGQGTVAFTGTGITGRQLLGGDLNGDNSVNMTDYNRLRYYWYTVSNVTDINGDGEVSLPDLNILKANWYVTGNAQ